MKTSRVVLGVLAGAAAGALIGVLFAPDKGSNTRRKITRKGQEWVGDVKNQVNHLKEQASGMMDHFAEKLHSTNETKAKAEHNRGKYATTER